MTTFYEVSRTEHMPEHTDDLDHVLSLPEEVAREVVAQNVSAADNEQLDEPVQPITSAWLAEKNSTLASQTPTVEEFDALSTLYERIDFGSTVAIDSATRTAIKLDVAEEFGRNVSVSNYLLNGDALEKATEAAKFDALFTSKDEVLATMGYEWYGAIENEHIGEDDLDAVVVAATKAAEEAKRALRLDAVLRERGYSEGDAINPVVEDELAIASIPVPAEDEPTANLTTWATYKDSLRVVQETLEPAIMPFSGGVQDDPITLRAFRRQFRADTMVPAFTEADEFGHADRPDFSAEVVSETISPEVEAGSAAIPTSGKKTAEQRAEQAAKMDASIEAINAAHEAEDQTVSLREKMRAMAGRVRAMGRLALYGAQPAQLVGLAANAAGEFAANYQPNNEHRSTLKRVALGAGLLVVAYATSKASGYGIDMSHFDPNSVDLSHLATPPVGGAGHVQSGLEAHLNLPVETPPIPDYLSQPNIAPPAPLSGFDTTPITHGTRVWDYMKHAGVSPDQINRTLEHAAEELRKTGVDVRAVGKGKHLRWVVDGKDDAATIVRAFRPYFPR